MIKDPGKAKVSDICYVDHVLRPIGERHITKLYTIEVGKVFIHHDKDSSHTASKTRDYLVKMNMKIGLNCIQNADFPVKSPAITPFDFYGLGFLKQELFKKRYRTLTGLWKLFDRYGSQ